MSVGACLWVSSNRHVVVAFMIRYCRWYVRVQVYPKTGAVSQLQAVTEGTRNNAITSLSTITSINSWSK